jgi:hypothetical protein
VPSPPRSSCKTVPHRYTFRPLPRREKSPADTAYDCQPSMGVILNARSVFAVDSQSISQGIGLALLTCTAMLAAPRLRRHWAVLLAWLALPLLARLFMANILTAPGSPHDHLHLFCRRTNCCPLAPNAVAIEGLNPKIQILAEKAGSQAGA